MKKRYIQPEAEFEEIEGLNDLLDQKSKLRGYGQTAGEGYEVEQPSGDVVDVGNDVDDDGLN